MTERKKRPADETQVPSAEAAVPALDQAALAGLGDLAWVSEMWSSPPEVLALAYRSLLRKRASENIGAALRLWRQRAGLTLLQVEASMGREVKRSYLSQVEKGRVATPRLDVILVLGNLYGIPRWEILDAIASAGDVIPDLQPGDRDSARLEELDRAFKFVADQPDFPIRITTGMFGPSLSPLVKFAMVRLYERGSGLRALRENFSEPPPPQEPPKEVKE